MSEFYQTPDGTRINANQIAFLHPTETNCLRAELIDGSNHPVLHKINVERRVDLLPARKTRGLHVGLTRDEDGNVNGHEVMELPLLGWAILSYVDHFDYDPEPEPVSPLGTPDMVVFEDGATIWLHPEGWRPAGEADTIEGLSAIIAAFKQRDERNRVLARIARRKAANV